MPQLYHPQTSGPGFQVPFALPNAAILASALFRYCRLISMPWYLRPNWTAAIPHGATPQKGEATFSPGFVSALINHRITDTGF
jgi:hypothetical protein